MKAIVCKRYGPPEVLTIEERKKGLYTKQTRFLIRIYTTTVTVADSRIRGFRVPSSMRLPARLALGIRRPRKEVLGVELAGIVEAIGNKVTKFRKGDKVFAVSLKDFGAYAEYISLPQSAAIAHIPDILSFFSGCCATGRRVHCLALSA